MGAAPVYTCGMPGALRKQEEGSFQVKRPLPGVAVVRFSGERPLMRAVPSHYGSTLHLSGRSRWSSGGEQWFSGPGTLSLKVPGEVAIERERQGTPSFQVVLFEPELLEEACTALGRPFVHPRRHAMEGRDPRARPLLSLHHRLLGQASLPALDEAVCDALHALTDELDGAEPGRRTRFSASVARARALLDERFTEPVSLEALAAHARLDKFRLCRAFRDQVGLPPHAYVTHRRVSRAQELLARGMPQAEVAALVGFYDQSLLHRHFKRILRVTPGVFARSATR